MRMVRLVFGACLGRLVLVSGVAIAAAMVTTAASAQVSDSERAAARELFKDGDQLQRAGHFADALDKFQRAQQVFAAPTNVLRIAECQAALGHLVASAEAYRDVLRTPLTANAPPAFQAAIDQARAELSQVDPRVPKLVVKVTQPASGANPKGPLTTAQMQLQIDGQAMSGALIGEAIPLDPGSHKVTVVASGYTTPETRVDLAERETKTVTVSLAPAGGVTIAAPLPPAPPPQPPPASDTPPPPPVITGEDRGPSGSLRSRASLLLGGHVGIEIPAGKIVDSNTNQSLDASSAASAGAAVGLDGGLRFARQWYLGLGFEYATLGSNSTAAGDVTRRASKTEQLAVVLGLMVNPERTSFYGEVGVGGRWLQVKEETRTNGTTSFSDSSGEVLVGAGIWIPAGRALRILPKATFGVASFGSSNTVSATDRANAALATYLMLGCAGFFNADL